MPEVSRIEIRVFPESGHHYFFAPFSQEILSAHASLAIVCEQDLVAWEQLSHSWLRGRLSMCDGRAGMLICLESNLGDIRRGSILEAKTTYSEQQAKNYPEDNPSPYAALDARQLSHDVDELPIELEFDGNKVLVAVLAIVWQQAAGQARDVDLVIDFGNTRTVVLALEHSVAQRGQLSTLCHNVRFLKSGVEYFNRNDPSNDSHSIVDSWFILHEPMFAAFEPPNRDCFDATEIEKEEIQVSPGGLFKKKQIETRYFGTKRIPQMFVELSPVVMGDGARETLANLNLAEGGNYTLSSPKRFVWDTDTLEVEGRVRWNMFYNRWNAESRHLSKLPKLEGSLFRFMHADGRSWEDIEAPPNESAQLEKRPSASPIEASYPRSDAMTWAALGIIELAARQITSEPWRAGNEPFVPRRLRRVLVTFPSGWTSHEISAYRKKWQQAVNIFTLAHLSDRRDISEGGSRPELVMNLDEAVASQLPIIYSEIRRFGNKGEAWVELMGRGKGTAATVRVMTVDIGGGTSDISIIEYRDVLAGVGVELEAKLLFRDSSTIAGDSLSRSIIESVLLPAIGSRFQGDPEQIETFENILKAPHDRVADAARWARIVKLVFLPIVRQWLKDLSEGRDASDEGTTWAPDRIMGAESRMVDVGALQEFNDICREKLDVDVMPDEDPVFHDHDRLKDCIDEVFRPLIRSLAKYVAAFEVDLVTLSGKPSELPQVKRLLEDDLPILPQRIIQAKNYPAGPWFPMSSNGRISDAKTVTAVGAALSQAIQHGLVSDWNIRRSDEGQAFPYYWGKMPNENTPWKFAPLYLDPYLEKETPTSLPGKDRVETRMQVGTCIGRKILPSAAKPEQVYRFRWKDKDQAKKAGFTANAALSVTLERDSTDPTVLVLVNCSDPEGSDLDRDLANAGGIELQPCSLEEREFWLDSGRFDVAWPDSF